MLCTQPDLAAASPPFLYGGDMIAEGRVLPDRVEYNALPWKYAAGTPDILGAIISAQALRLLLDLPLTPRRPACYGTGRPLDRAAVRAAMDRVAAWNRQLTTRALDAWPPSPGSPSTAPATRPGAHRWSPSTSPPRPRQRRAGAEPGQGGIARRLPLRHPRPPRTRANPAGQLPPQLLPLQHPRRGGPGGGRGSRRCRPPQRVRGAPVPVLAARTGLAADSGDIGMTVLDAAERQQPRNARPSYGDHLASPGDT